MSANKHTPGPWVLTPGLDVVMSHGDDTFQPVAIVNGVKHLRRGDAHIIAAAPDMLEALSTLLEMYEQRTIGEVREGVPFWQALPEVVAARAAIRKARGES